MQCSEKYLFIFSFFFSKNSKFLNSALFLSSNFLSFTWSVILLLKTICNKLLNYIKKLHFLILIKLILFLISNIRNNHFKNLIYVHYLFLLYVKLHKSKLCIIKQWDWLIRRAPLLAHRVPLDKALESIIK